MLTHHIPITITIIINSYSGSWFSLVRKAKLRTQVSARPAVVTWERFVPVPPPHL